jgi:hypothetical protein
MSEDTLRRLREVYSLASRELYSQGEEKRERIRKNIGTKPLETIVPEYELRMLDSDARKELIEKGEDHLNEKKVNERISELAINKLLLQRIYAVPHFLTDFIQWYKATYTATPICKETPASGNVSYTVNKLGESEPAISQQNVFVWKTRGISNLKNRAFPNSGRVELLNEPNILIIGGGPIGLYMAGILRICLPRVRVNVVEGRVEGKERKLTRISSLRLGYTEPYKTVDGKVYCLPQNADAVLDSIYSFLMDLCPSIYTLLVGNRNDARYLNLVKHIFDGVLTVKPIFDAEGKQLGSTEHRDYIVMINYFEAIAARFAQEHGVNIYHDEKIDTEQNKLEYIEDTYTNEYTKVVFDSTGGRLLTPPEGRFERLYELIESKRMDPKVTLRAHADYEVKHLPNNVKQRYKANSMIQTPQGKQVAPILVGVLQPEEAVYKRKSYIYCALGETFMKTYYNYSNSISNGTSLCLAIALCLAKEYAEPQGGKRKTRNRGRNKRNRVRKTRRK